MKTYTTTQGDTWDYIALKELGSEMYMHLLTLWPYKSVKRDVKNTFLTT